MEVNTQEFSDLSDLSDLSDVVSSFAIQGRLLSAEHWGTGHINETLRVTVEGGGRRSQYILQRLNSRVFKRPELVMQNVVRVTARLNRQEGALTGRLDPGARADPLAEWFVLAPRCRRRLLAPGALHRRDRRARSGLQRPRGA